MIASEYQLSTQQSNALPANDIPSVGYAFINFVDVSRLHDNALCQVLS
jgi:hypothetical protein